MILDCNKITKSFGSATLFHDLTFHIEKGEKWALTGKNGCGKSTLLKIITGQYSYDSGNLVIAKNTETAYLSQYQEAEGNCSIYEYVLEEKIDLVRMEEKIRELETEMRSLSGDALDLVLKKYHQLTQTFEQNDGFAVHSLVTGVLKGLGFSESDYSRPVDTLSGGQKTRLALGRILLSSPDLLLLDEPTNHLDIQAVNWLEGFLSSFGGSLLIVSHDRYFLDHTVDHVIEIENQTAISFPGNYTAYAAKKEMVIKAQMAQYLKQCEEIRHQEEVIKKLKSFNREKSIKRAESREKKLQAMTRLEKPQTEDSSMHLNLKTDRQSGSNVLSVREISKSFGENILFRDLSFEIKRGEKVAIIGDNGTGKTTILKIIMQAYAPDQGSVETGTGVDIGYYDQAQQIFDPNKTVYQEISDTYPDMTETQIRSTCAAFLFTGDDVFLQISNLSGGELAKLSLLKLMLSGANFLILDEPTNHLDAVSREILEDAINHYDGTVLYVSHDRYFINKTADRILDLRNRILIEYLGNYDYYLEKREELLKTFSDGGDSDPEESALKISDSERKRQLQKAEQTRIRRIKNSLAKTESQIAKLESEIAEAENEINAPENAADPVKLNELFNRQTALKEELEPLYTLWEELSEEDTD